jgi:enoyl-[acyl-carrier protein] reductase III
VDKNKTQFSHSWAIILGGSSGFGIAAVEKLATHGMNVAVLYRETAAAERLLKKKFLKLAETCAVNITPFNINALDISGRKTFIEKFTANNSKKHSVRLLLHSIARGNLKPLFLPDADFDKSNEVLSVEDIQFTTYAMSSSILDWVRSLLKADLFQADARIIGLTSEGAHRYWEGYAAVSVAKASLESLATYMAIELSKYGLKTNLIQAGIAETSSLKKIPGSKKLIRLAKERNPFGRLTKPTDVANVIYLLCSDEASWINGSLIHVDGGEHCR